jgi:hypothetical protein
MSTEPSPALAPHIEKINALVAAKTTVGGSRRRRQRGGVSDQAATSAAETIAQALGQTGGRRSRRRRRRQRGGVSDQAATSAAETIAQALGQTGGRRSRRLRRRSGKSRRHATRSYSAGGKRNKRSTYRRKRMSGGIVLL